LQRPRASRLINTSFVERHQGTDRHHSADKARRSNRFSKDWWMHEAMTYLTAYSFNSCWPVRTLRERDREGWWRKRTPAMAAGLGDHVWSLKEWLTLSAIPRLEDTTVKAAPGRSPVPPTKRHVASPRPSR
jgi:hypothetical protein